MLDFNHVAPFIIPGFFGVIAIIMAFVGAYQTSQAEAAERAAQERRAAEAEAKRRQREAAAEEKARKAAAKAAAEANKPKRGPGRPRKNPLPDPNAPKRKPGRPRKNPEAVTKPEPKTTALEHSEVPFIKIAHINVGYYDLPTHCTPQEFESFVC